MSLMVAQWVQYFTATVETQGRARTSGAAWSSLLAHLSSESSPVSHVVQTARVMAWDSTDHVAWVAPLAAASPSADLVNSYAEVVDELARRASAQRTWVTFRIPLEEVTAIGAHDDAGCSRCARCGRCC